MLRLPAVGALVLLAAACAEPTSPPAASSGAPASSAVPIDQSATPLDIAVIGDVPYGDAARASFPSFIDGINRDPEVRLAVHVGDIKSGQRSLLRRRSSRSSRSSSPAFADPLVYAIGDNEWTDCHRANNGGYNPLDRLSRHPRTFSSRHPGSALGRPNMRIEAEEGYPENQLWTARAGLRHLPHPGLEQRPRSLVRRRRSPPGETPAKPRPPPGIRRTERRQPRVAGADLRVARTRQRPGRRALLPGRPLAPGRPGRRRHRSLPTPSSSVASPRWRASFKGPVLLVAGDSHDYRVDVGVPWFSLYGADAASQRHPDHRGSQHRGRRRLAAAPRRSAGVGRVFSWEEVVVP